MPYWNNARALALLYKKDVMNKQNCAVGTTNVLVVHQLLVKFRTRIATKTGQTIGSGELSSPVGLIHKKG